MKIAKLKFLFDRRGKASATHKGTVEVGIFYGPTRKYFSLRIHLLPHQWCDMQVVDHPDAVALNGRISYVRNIFNDYVAKCDRLERAFSFAEFGEIFNRPMTGSVKAYIEEKIEERLDIRDSTKRTQRKLISALDSFGRIRTFEDVTAAMVKAFDNFLRGRGIRQTTIHSYHKTFKTYISMAVSEGFLDESPYRNFKVPVGHSEQRKYLTEDELNAIRAVRLPYTLGKVRDTFVFQCLTGMAYADLNRFDFENVTKRGDRYVLHAQRQKSSEDYYVVLLPEAVEILKRYNNRLPLMTIEQYNLRLKAVADFAGVEKRLTSHMGRHTFAVNALNLGIPIEVVSKILGHTSVQTTQLYAKVVNKSIDSAFDLLAGKL